jgi:hypothetical protein
MKNQTANFIYSVLVALAFCAGVIGFTAYFLPDALDRQAAYDKAKLNQHIPEEYRERVGK